MADIKVRVVRYKDRQSLLLQWTHPLTGKRCTKSAGTSRRREAERKAQRLEQELQQAGDGGNVLWQDFVDECTDSVERNKSTSTLRLTIDALRHVTEILQPRLLSDVTAKAITAWQNALQDRGLAPASVGVYSRHLRAALNWAVRQGLLAKAPHIDMPASAETNKAKGQPVNAVMFDQMLKATPKVVGASQAAPWVRLLWGLWLSGLRLGEALRLSWDGQADVSVCTEGRFPALRFRARGQKSRRYEVAPLAPDAGEYFLETPEEERQGLVFPVGYPSNKAGVLTEKHASRVIGKIGKAALANYRASGGTWQKAPTAHDLRRGFGTKWASRLMPSDLMALMRHRKIATTLTYYVSRDADEIAARLWKVGADDCNKTATEAGQDRCGAETNGRKSLKIRGFGQEECRPQMLAD